MDTIKTKQTKKSADSSSLSEYDVEKMEDELLNICNDDAMSCSSGTLEDDSDDGINVTIVPKKNMEDGKAPEDKQEDIHDKDDIEEDRKRTGSEKKRIRKLLNEGYTYKEACEALFPRTEGKMKRLLDRTNSSEDNPKPKKVKEQQVPSGLQKNNKQRKRTHKNQSYSTVAGQVRIGIVPEEYPSVEMSPKQLEDVQEAILSKVILQREGEFKPKFLNCLYRSGYLVLVCENQQTANWLKTITPLTEPWDGAKIIAVDEEKIPRPEVLLAFFPKSAGYKDEKIIELIESQNALKTSSWRILSRTVKNDLHMEWAITVDHASMVELEKTDYCINYKFTKTRIFKAGWQKTPNNDTENEGVPTNVVNKASGDKDDQCLENSRNTGEGLSDNTDQLHRPGPSGVKKTCDGPGNKNAGYVRNMDLTREVLSSTSRDRSKSSIVRQKSVGNPRDRISNKGLQQTAPPRPEKAKQETRWNPSLQTKMTVRKEDG